MNFENNIPKVDGKNEKQKKLEDFRLQVDEIGDGLGLSVDEGIKDGVAVFMAHGFPTNDSCHGHLTNEEEGRLFLFPRVGVCAPEPEGWEEDEEKKAEWRSINEKYQEKILALLGEFYKNRDADSIYRIVIEPIGIFGAFRITNKLDDNMSQEEKQNMTDQTEILEKSRKEMNDFLGFLKEKFLNT